MLLWHGSRLTNWTGILSQGHSYIDLFLSYAYKCMSVCLFHDNCKLSECTLYVPPGLRIAPPEAPVTGYMFGKGIYFADMFSKSANYCYATRAVTAGVLLLCEVCFCPVQC